MEKRGRPSRFTKAIATRICERLSTGETLRSICRDEHFPAESTVRNWALNDISGFFAHYARARDIGLEAIADETIDLADTPRLGEKLKRSTCPKCKGSGSTPEADPDAEKKKCERCEGTGGISEVTTGDMVERSRLQVDARKWYLSKMAPKRYGERPDSDSGKHQDDGMRQLAEAIANSPK